MDYQKKNTSRLLRLAGQAPYLAKMWFAKAYLQEHFSLSDVKKGMANKQALVKQFEHFLQNHGDVALALRQLKYSTLLQITERALLFPQDIERTWTDLSQLANCILDIALGQTYRAMHHEGVRQPLLKDSSDIVPLSLVSLGKLGAQELNYSSDVDLLFIYLTNIFMTENVLARSVIFCIVQSGISAQIICHRMPYVAYSKLPDGQ